MHFTHNKVSSPGGKKELKNARTKEASKKNKTQESQKDKETGKENKKGKK